MTVDQSSGIRSAEDVSLADLLTPLARRWRVLLGIPILSGLLAFIVSLVLPPVFIAQTTLTPASSSAGGLSGGGLAGLAGLAGQLGVATASGASISPEFIADVLKSREVLTTTLQSHFHSNADNGERPLLDILRVEGRNQAARLSQGVSKLGHAVETEVDRPTGIVTLRVEAGDPKLAADIANQMLVILNDFNLERRQSQSREQARFTRERLTEAQTELRQAEAAQLRFFQANREYRGSPLLEFEAGRLQRAVDLRQEVYVSLVKAYDEARISQVRDTPVIMTIDSAVAPQGPSAPRPMRNFVLAFLAGGIIAFGLVFLLEQRGRGRRAAEADYRRSGAGRSQTADRESATSARDTAAAER
jgi:tyrosine-protein kinase Etk/Wzc